MSEKYWEGQISSRELKSLNMQLWDEEVKAGKIQKPIIDKINELIKNCKHNYKLTGRLAYERYFTCTICGDEITK